MTSYLYIFCLLVIQHTEQSTVGENNIGSPKIYTYLVLSKISDIAACKVIAINLICFIFSSISS